MVSRLVRDRSLTTRSTARNENARSVSLLRSNADRIAWERTSSRNRITVAASVRLCVGGKFCQSRSFATLMASIITRSELIGKNPHNAAVPVFDGVDFDIYTLDGLGSSLALEDAVDVSGGVPAVDKQIAHLGTLVIAGPCAQRADRIAILMLLGAELPGFVRGNPPSSTSSATVLPLAPEAHQFFLTGEPGIADRYFPWLVNLMSPAYWVYLVMAVTILFNALKAFSRFRLWRIDAAREKLETALKELLDPRLTHAQMRAVPAERVTAVPVTGRSGAAAVDPQAHATITATRWLTKSAAASAGSRSY